MPQGQDQEEDEVKINLGEDENKIAKHFTLNSKSPVSFRPREDVQNDLNIKTHENIDYNYKVGLYDKYDNPPSDEKSLRKNHCLEFLLNPPT